MSYNVAVVVPPVPADDARAWAALDRMIEEGGSMPAVFRQLHDRLTARYPCLTAVPEDAIDDSVWSDGPLIDNFGHRAAVLGLARGRVDEVLPFLVAAANELGLIVFDWSTATIHRG